MEPNWDAVPYLLHTKGTGYAGIFPAANRVGHGFPRTLLRDVTDCIDAEKAFNEHQAANPHLREELCAVWYQVPDTRSYRVEIRRVETIGDSVGDVSGKRLPKRPRTHNPGDCANRARYVEVDKASPFVGVAVRLVCACGLVHWAKAVDGYRVATDVPIRVIADMIRRQTYKSSDGRFVGHTITDSWFALSVGGDFPHTTYRAPLF